jgi:uncharacterized protein (TIGR00369 family)
MKSTTAQGISEDYHRLSGMEFLSKLMRDGTESPMGELLNLSVVAVTDGEVAIRGVPDEKFYNPMFRIHGGWTSTLIDTALGSAVVTKIPAGTGVGTVQLNINLVRKIEVTTGPMIATAKVLHAGRSMLTAEVKVCDEKGVLYAHGSGTFMVYPKPSR